MEGSGGFLPGTSNQNRISFQFEEITFQYFAVPGGNPSRLRALGRRNPRSSAMRADTLRCLLVAPATTVPKTVSAMVEIDQHQKHTHTHMAKWLTPATAASSRTSNYDSENTIALPGVSSWDWYESYSAVEHATSTDDRMVRKKVPQKSRFLCRPSAVEDLDARLMVLQNA